MEIRINGPLPAGVTAKDFVLGIIGTIGTDGATGYVVEYTGEAVRGLSMEGRMTVCNMSIEAGARAGMVAPDEVTFAYLRGRRFSPARHRRGIRRSRAGSALRSEPGARYDKVVEIDAAKLAPFVTWGTNPGMVVPVTGRVPDPAAAQNAGRTWRGRARAAIHGAHAGDRDRGRSA